MCVFGKIGLRISAALIITPPSLSPDVLSHLIAVWPFCTRGEGCEGVSHVSQKHIVVACLRSLSHSMSGSLEVIDLAFYNEIIIWCHNM